MANKKANNSTSNEVVNNNNLTPALTLESLAQMVLGIGQSVNNLSSQVQSFVSGSHLPKSEVLEVPKDKVKEVKKIDKTGTAKGEIETPAIETAKTGTVYAFTCKVKTDKSKRLHIPAIAFNKNGTCLIDGVKVNAVKSDQNRALYTPSHLVNRSSGQVVGFIQKDPKVKSYTSVLIGETKESEDIAVNTLLDAVKNKGSKGTKEVKEVVKVETPANDSTSEKDLLKQYKAYVMDFDGVPVSFDDWKTAIEVETPKVERDFLSEYKNYVSQVVYGVPLSFDQWKVSQGNNLTPETKEVKEVKEVETARSKQVDKVNSEKGLSWEQQQLIDNPFWSIRGNSLNRDWFEFVRENWVISVEKVEKMDKAILTAKKQIAKNKKSNFVPNENSNLKDNDGRKWLYASQKSDLNSIAYSCGVSGYENLAGIGRLLLK